MNKGDFVRIDFVGKLESGEIFDLTREDVAEKEKIYSEKSKYKPVPVIVGAGFMIPGIDKALESLNVGDKKSLDISPEDGFGKRDAKLVRVVPAKAFEGQMEPRQGLIVDFSGMKGRIQSVSGGRVTVDFNNPLAGKTLKYEIEVKEKIEGYEDQAKAILEFFGVEKSGIRLDNKTIDVETQRLPDVVKDRAGKLMMDYMKPDGIKLEKIRFIEIYESGQGAILSA